MRSKLDRIRHAVAFEVTGLFLVVVILSQFGFDITHTGVLGIVFSLIATIWNYIYSSWFDKLVIKISGSTEKKQIHRILQAIGFELGLLILTIPAIALWMHVSLWQAFLMDIGLVIFYLFYSYVYNICYDKIYPINITKTTN